MALPSCNFICRYCSYKDTRAYANISLPTQAKILSTPNGAPSVHHLYSTCMTGTDQSPMAFHKA
eukprot:c39768_g1_i1 orf=2-190(-)